MRTVYGDHDRFEKTYFSKFPGYYMSGDGAKRDKVNLTGLIQWPKKIIYFPSDDTQN